MVAISFISRFLRFHRKIFFFLTNSNNCCSIPYPLLISKGQEGIKNLILDSPGKASSQCLVYVPSAHHFGMKPCLTKHLYKDSEIEMLEEAVEMKEGLFRKTLVFGIIFCFLGINVISDNRGNDNNFYTGRENAGDYLDQLPQEEWNRTFGKTGQRAEGRSVQQTSEGGYIITGWVGDSIWLVKTDSNGNEQWNKTFKAGRRSEGYAVQQTADGGYILVGTIYPHKWNKEGIPLSDIWLVKTDSNGNEQWNKTFGKENYGEGAYAGQQTADGGYIVAGFQASDYQAGYQECDVWLIKTDSNGNEQWSKTFGKENYLEMALAVQQTVDGGYIIAGFQEDDVWLIKTDSNGNEQWNKTFGGSEEDVACSVQQTVDGGYIIAGSTRSFGIGRFDVWLVKTDSNGNEQWSKTFGGSEEDAAWSVQQTVDGGYIVAGYTHSFGVGHSDVWLIKLSMGGNQPPIADADGPYSGTVGEDIIFNASDSYDPDGDIVGYRWDWTNDGVWDTNWSSSPITTHCYFTAGNYTVRLQVKDDRDGTAVNFSSVEISEMRIEGHCPIDLMVIDPIGRCINKSWSNIPDATYSEKDLDGDGDLDDQICIKQTLSGNYTITVESESSINATDMFSLFVIYFGKSYCLAKNTNISDIPDEPYVFNTTDEEPPEIDFVKPLEKSLYIFNKKLLPFPITLVIGDIDVKAYALDNKTVVNHVEFYINNELKANVSTEPYVWRWSEKTFGKYTIKVVAYDSFGNHASKEITVWKFF